MGLGKADQALMQKWLQGRKWGVYRWVIADRDKWRCQLQISSRCTKLLGDRFEIDHIIPRKEMTDINQFWNGDNVRLVCKDCHRLHTQRQNRSRDTKEVRDELERYSVLRGQ